MNSIRKRHYRRAIFITLLAFFISQFILADELDDKTREISNKLRCPTCQPMSVKDSEAGLSNNMKHKIRELLEEGKSEDEILDFFVERYGEWILRSPKKSGFALLLWVLPGVVLVIAAAILIYAMKRRASSAKMSELKPLTGEEAEKIENALKKI